MCFVRSASHMICEQPVWLYFYFSSSGNDVDRFLSYTMPIKRVPLCGGDTSLITVTRIKLYHSVETKHNSVVRPLKILRNLTYSRNFLQTSAVNVLTFPPMRGIALLCTNVTTPHCFYYQFRFPKAWLILFSPRKNKKEPGRSHYEHWCTAKGKRDEWLCSTQAQADSLHSWLLFCQLLLSGRTEMRTLRGPVTQLWG